MMLNDGKTDRKTDKSLLGYRIDLPQLEGPNGLRESRKLFRNHPEKTSNDNSKKIQRQIKEKRTVNEK